MTTTHADSPDDRLEAIRSVEGEFVNMVGRFRRLIVRRADRLSPGLLPGTYKVFVTISQSGPITATAVAEQMVLDKGHLSRAVSSLEGLGLVMRTPDPADRRAQLLEVTPEGRAKFEEIRDDPSERTLRDKLAQWNVHDVRRLATLLHALNEEA
ncbi:MarR family winged helix-turn-helix transcriptional regulator [Microbacterium gubbeenense]|uniref:MarR family winged helix-turn-helix transcriptional regulator n=3 Tax=Microbacterium gubbeenense TaxID=159896 RepID=UPI003F951A4B